jgi:hypothetical protein
MAVIINASTSTGLVQSADTSGIIQFQSNGSTKATLNSSGFSYPGGVVQVVSTTKTDTFSTSSTSYTDLTGLSVSITPTSATSKVLVFYTVNGKQTTTPSMRLVRNSTAICIADSWGGNQSTAGTFQGGPDTNQTTQIAGNFLDSPATTSATTYKVQVITDSGTVYYNRSPSDYYTRYTSTITVMEIAA